MKGMLLCKVITGFVSTILAVGLLPVAALAVGEKAVVDGAGVLVAVDEKAATSNADILAATDLVADEALATKVGFATDPQDFRSDAAEFRATTEVDYPKSTLIALTRGTIKLNKTYTLSARANSASAYKFKVAKAGRVTIGLSNKASGNSVNLVAYVGSKSKDITWLKSNSGYLLGRYINYYGNNKNRYFYLEPGTYFIVYHNDSYNAKTRNQFKIRLSYKACKESFSDKMPGQNNTRKTADRIYFNRTYSGVMGAYGGVADGGPALASDLADQYKFTVGRTINFKVSSKASANALKRYDWYAIYNSKGIQIARTDLGHSIHTKLPKGTYYLVVTTNSSSGTGLGNAYKFKMTYS